MQFPFLCLAILCCVQGLNALNCYECTEAPGVETPADKTCSHIMSQGLTTKCADSSPYCVKITGNADGKSVEIRKCADSNFKTLLGDNNNCKGTEEVSNFRYLSTETTTSSTVEDKIELVVTSDTITTKKTTKSKSGNSWSSSSSSSSTNFEDGAVCICDSDKCDPAAPKTEVFACWQCMDGGVIPANNCTNVMANGKPTPCPGSTKYCMKAVAMHEGKELSSRICVDDNLLRVFGGKTNECMDAKDIPQEFRNPKDGLQKEGTMCICDSSECNPASFVYPLSALITLGVAALILRYFSN